MNVQTILLIILAAIVALGIVFFQYHYRTKKKDRFNVVLSFLRFVTLFSAFLLLINPKFSKNEYTTEKANLIILVDNSTSVADYRADIENVLGKLNENQKIGERFDIERYRFGSSLEISESLPLTEKNTDIFKALSDLKEIYSATNSAVIMLSDGNQTIGQDYSFYGKNQNFPIYPIAIGDTTQYEDLAVSQVNANRFAFLKNKYPIELYLSYTGVKNINSQVEISVNGKTVFQQQVSLSNTKNTVTINTLLEANSVGLKSIVVSVGNLPNERNIANNKKEIGVEVIDEKTNIAIISNIQHPDIGALKKAIAVNEQRVVSIKKPQSNVVDWESIDLFVCYQPDPSFLPVYEYIQQKKANLFTITGSQTNWNFLNKMQKAFTKNSYNQTEEVFPVLNEGFTLFNISGFSIQDLPPLETNLGETVLNRQAEVLLNQRIKGIELEEPLLAIFGDGAQREAVLFGENSWKWRVQSFRNEQTFKNFDDFIGKIILYLSTNKSRERLSVDYESVYNTSGEAKILATYFDKTFIFDENATITIKTKNSDSKKVTEMPMLLKGNYYESDLDNLAAGKYDFTVTVKDENLSKSGSFTILDFDVEKQFLSTDDQKLKRLAQNTSGKLFYPSQIADLLDTLTTDNRFLPTQISNQNVVSLIDFRILLAIIVTALTAEWFIRKYNGLL